MRTENLSIVFVDIAGFTPRTSSQTREENEQMLQRFADLVKPLARVYNGKVVKNIGDAYLLTFRSPTDALLCSTAIHDRLAESNAEVGEKDRFDVRAAVNVGEVRLERGDIFGEAVNIAARIEGKTGAGEVYFSEAVYLSMTRSEVPAEEVGHFELKGIADKVRLYRVPRAGDAGAYALASHGNGTPDGADVEMHPLAPCRLPFAGLGLNAVRDRLRRPTGPARVLVVQSRYAQGWLRRLRDLGHAALQATRRGAARWGIEVRRSRRWRIGTAIVVVAVMSFLVWGLWPEKPQPKRATPWQRIQRNLGF